MLVHRPSDDDILSAASYWGARDADHPLTRPISYMQLLARCGVYLVHGAPDCVSYLERQIRDAYCKYGLSLREEKSGSKRYED